MPLGTDGNVKTETNTPQPEMHQASALAPPPLNGGLSGTATSGTTVVKTETDEKPILLPHEWTESYGWEDLTLKEQVRRNNPKAANTC